MSASGMRPQDGQMPRTLREQMEALGRGRKSEECGVLGYDATTGEAKAFLARFREGGLAYLQEQGSTPFVTGWVPMGLLSVHLVHGVVVEVSEPSFVFDNQEDADAVVESFIAEAAPHVEAVGTPGTFSTSGTIAAPADTVPGKLLLLILAGDGGDPVLTDPGSDWTALPLSTQAGMRLRMWWRLAGSGSNDADLSGPTTAGGVMLRISSGAVGSNSQNTANGTFADPQALNAPIVTPAIWSLVVCAITATDLSSGPGVLASWGPSMAPVMAELSVNSGQRLWVFAHTVTASNAGVQQAANITGNTGASLDCIGQVIAIE